MRNDLILRAQTRNPTAIVDNITKTALTVRHHVVIRDSILKAKSIQAEMLMLRNEWVQGDFRIL